MFTLQIVNFKYKYCAIIVTLILSFLTFSETKAQCSYIDQVSSISLPINPNQILLYQDTLAIIRQNTDSLAITIVNIADPNAPQIVAVIDSVSMYNLVSSIALDSNILYVGTHQTTIGVDSLGLFGGGGVVARFDLTDPLNPIQLSGVDVVGGVWQLSAHNNKVFVAIRTVYFKTGYSLIDFSNSSMPVEVGHDLWWNNPTNWVFDVASDTSGRYTYLAAGDSGLLVYDNTLLPQNGPVASLKVTSGTGEKTATSLSVQGDRLLVTGNYTSYQPLGNSLNYYNISSPSLPVQIGLRGTVQDFGRKGKLNDKYMLWFNGGTIYVEDTANHSGSWWSGTKSTDPGNYRDFQRSGEYIFTTTVNRVGYGIFDSLKVYRFTDIPRPPYFSVQNTYYVNEGQELKFTVYAYEDDGCGAQIDTSNINPVNMFFKDFVGGYDVDSLQVTFLPDWNQAGSHNVTFQASDIDDTSFFTVTVIVNDRTPLFNPPVDYSFPYWPGGPHGTAAADFDKDGDIDIIETGGKYVSASLSYYFLRLLDNDGTGLFTQILEDTLPHNPIAPATADLNGDTFPDIVIPYYDFNNIPGYDSIAVMINNGDGTFAPSVLYQTGPGSRYVHLYDADGDNDIDISAIAFDDSTIATILNNGDGTFGAPTSFSAVGQPKSIASGDIDGDNDLDLVIPARRLWPLHPEFQVYLNNGNGTFVFDTAYISARSVSDIKAGDMDADGDIDMVVTRDDTLTVMLNNGSGRFTFIDFVTIRYMTYLDLADIDGNNSLDVLVASNNSYFGGGVFQVFQNNGNGTLTQPVNYSAGGGVFGITIADIDGDSDIDAIVTDQGAQGVQIVTNNTLVSNHPPIFLALNYDQLTVIEGDTLKAIISTTDVDGQVAAITASGLPSGASLFDNNNGTADLTFTPGFNQAGRYPVSLFASDGLDIKQHDIQIVVFNGDGLFSHPVDYQLSGTPTAVATADVDNDNDKDVVISTVTPNTVEVWSNDGAAVFQIFGSHGLSGPPSAMAIGDFDGDLDIDIAVASDSANIIDILMNNGSGIYSASVVYPNGGNSVVAADFDLDNDMDIAIARADSTAGVYLLKNDSNGVCSPGVWHFAGASPIDMAGDDFDGNGSVDLAVADASTGHVWVLLSNGNGFAPAKSYAADRQLKTITTSDFDGDNDIDILVSSYITDTVTVLLNNGDGTFYLGWQGEFGYRPSDLYAGILKSGESVSITGVGSTFGGSYYVSTVSHNIGGGAFQTVDSTDLYWCASRPVSIEGARLDADGDDDIIILQTQPNVLTILSGNSDSPVSVNDEENLLLPKKFELYQNYPNPFNPSTSIRFAIPVNSDVELQVFNIIGQKVVTLVNKRLSIGEYMIEWDGTSTSGNKVASGIYFYQLVTENYTSSKKMLLLK